MLQLKKKKNIEIRVPHMATFSVVAAIAGFFLVKKLRLFGS